MKIGVVGLALAGTPTMSQPGDIKFANELETLRAQAGKLRQAGADILVAVAHTDRDMDDAIVRSRLVDVLLTGHDHDLAIGYDGKTVMVEAARRATSSPPSTSRCRPPARARTARSPGRRASACMTVSTVDPDPEVGAAVKKLEDALSKELDVVVGTSASELDSRSAIVRSQEAAIGNLIADAVKASTGATAPSPMAAASAPTSSTPRA